MVESIKREINESVKMARGFVLDGAEQILNGRLDEAHGISISPGATALAALAQLIAGNEYRDSHRAGLRWLRQNRSGKGWGKVPNGAADSEITRLVKRVQLGSLSGGLAQYLLPGHAQELGNIVLALGQKVVHGIEGPEPDEIRLPHILAEKALHKLPPYGRPVVIAASILAADNLDHPGVNEAVAYLCEQQMDDGSWSEDIIGTSLALIALARARVSAERVHKAGQWLQAKQYDSGAWPAFDQLCTWSVGLAVHFFMEFPRSPDEDEWIGRAVKWLAAGQNADGSYGSTPPFTQPDLDDTAVALMALQHFKNESTQRAVELLQRLQNSDGSWGTFPSYEGVPPAVKCMSPVYIASTDVSIHILDALWGIGAVNGNTVSARGLQWLLEQQLLSGEMPGTWYEGPVYATAQTLELLSKWSSRWRVWPNAGRIADAQIRLFQFLLSLRNSDGSWGSSVIETSLALAALCLHGGQLLRDILHQGASTIIARQSANGSFKPSYQGIYAKEWNYEEPLTTALTAIRALERYKRLQR